MSVASCYKYVNICCIIMVVFIVMLNKCSDNSYYILYLCSWTSLVLSKLRL